MQINEKLLYRKLDHLKNYLSELESLKDVKFEEYQENFLIRRAVERLAQLIVEVASDINSHIIAKTLKKSPDSYRNSFELLAELNIISEDFAQKLALSAGLRNKIVHDYYDIEDKIVYGAVSDFLRDYPQYLEKIRKHINSEVK